MKKPCIYIALAQCIFISILVCSSKECFGDISLTKKETEEKTRPTPGTPAAEGRLRDSTPTEHTSSTGSNADGGKQEETHSADSAANEKSVSNPSAEELERTKAQLEEAQELLRQHQALIQQQQQLMLQQQQDFIRQQQQLLLQQQAMMASGMRVQQQEQELGERRAAFAAQQQEMVPPQEQSQPQVQPQPQPRPVPPPLPPRSSQEPMGINGFMGSLFGQPVEDALNGPGRNLEKLISSAAGRRGQDAQAQAFNALGSLFSSLFRR